MGKSPYVELGTVGNNATVKVFSFMMTEGLILMVAGMGTVVLFLGLLCAIMRFSAFIFVHYIRETEPAVAASHRERITTDDAMDVAVALAVIRHTQTR